MSFYMLKKAAIECLDEISPADVWPNYGGDYTDNTRLDDLELTKMKRRTKAKNVNDFFSKRYKDQWEYVSNDEMGACDTIGNFIAMMARHASAGDKP